MLGRQENIIDAKEASEDSGSNNDSDGQRKLGDDIKAGNLA